MNMTDPSAQTEAQLKCYMAPLEGVTRYSYRNPHSQCFGKLDKYFTPFIVPAEGRPLRTRETRDVAPENNQGLFVVPQILTNRADWFVALAKELEQLGYPEVNLNLGCPSGTVAGKGRGAGFLREPEALDRFLDQIYRESTVKISIKSRIGVENVDEFGELLRIMNQYPMSEFILHPRLLKDHYKGHPHMEQFQMAYESCRVPLIYNGDLFRPEEIHRMQEQYPHLSGVMLGRGLIANPGLWEMVQGRPMTREQLKHFHDRLYRAQVEAVSGEKNAMFRVKELWFYMVHCFVDGDRYLKKLKKVHTFRDYEAWISMIFREAEFDPAAGFRPPGNTRLELRG